MMLHTRAFLACQSEMKAKQGVANDSFNNEVVYTRYQKFARKREKKLKVVFPFHLVGSSISSIVLVE